MEVADALADVDAAFVTTWVTVAVIVAIPVGKTTKLMRKHLKEQ